MYRFYNNLSSFVHGGLDAPNRETLPVIGQKQIHNRIQQLNFRDCHAKITQVTVIAIVLYCLTYAPLSRKFNKGYKLFHTNCLNS